jgi:hypothetical protein
VGLALATWTATHTAHAFEREWHLGGGLGVSDGKGLSLSPALGVYAAYGLSDAFDARLELTARGYHIGSAENPNAFSAMAGLTYKLDVLQWIPWGGVYAGYQTFLSAPRVGLPFSQRDMVLGLGFGLDYAWSRDFGLGVTARFDDGLSHSTAMTDEVLLRAEYRWGW